MASSRRVEDGVGRVGAGAVLYSFAILGVFLVWLWMQAPRRSMQTPQMVCGRSRAVSLGAEEVSDCGFLEGALGVPGLPYFDVRRSLARYRRGWRARTFAMEAGVRIKSRSSKPGAFCGGDGPEWVAQAIYCRSHRHVLFF
jgi:hypothetical protein